jgi:hypothetical protein
MVLIDVQIAPAFEIETKSPMPRHLLQHVIEEPQAGGDPVAAIAAAALVRQIDSDADVGFLGLAMH